MGFRYLYDTGYIDREMDIWYHVSENHLSLDTPIDTSMG